MAGKPSAAMENAKKSILAGKLTVYRAAEKYKLSAAYIQRQQWYREHIAGHNIGVARSRLSK